MASTEASQSFVQDSAIKSNERQSNMTYTELTIHAPISKSIRTLLVPLVWSEVDTPLNF